ncbi:hypothetical protein QP400_07830 [Winkia sp. UMB3158]|uniref:Uncharacterized protein n=1 Tax=Winkia neuii subsp. anitrata TaxID=29318 RepID=A0AB38XPH4_9ACTO|nr:MULTISPECIES: hypothetical protein [Winkia]MDK7150028.1 hypothetical protein [Winkia sp. UMB3158]MDK8341043.1 hypothetical protein [Winkia sp. UMB3164B]MBS5947540.1 hypothetical protein [Winkia neuii]MCG7302874.1 hypothetical protein [Winkia sp. ACRQY]MDK6241144.1 hypothetical protein [Winkia sp. UMB10116]
MSCVNAVSVATIAEGGRERWWGKDGVSTNFRGRPIGADFGRAYPKAQDVAD